MKKTGLRFKKPLSKAGRRLLDVAMRGAEEFILDKRPFAPVVLTVNKRDEMTVAAVKARTPEDVEQFIAAQSKGCKAAAFVSEAWHSTVSKAKSPALYSALVSGEDVVSVPPIDDPSRIEVLMIKLRQADGRLVVVTAMIQPDRKLSAWEIRAG